MAHTSGPWTLRRQFSNRYLISKDMHGVETVLCSVTTTGCEVGVEGPTEDNARLIAAAPDLLEALEMFMAIFADYQYPQPFLIRAKAAIRKAREGV